MNPINLLELKQKEEKSRKLVETDLRHLLATSSDDEVVAFVLKEIFRVFNNGLYIGAHEAMNGKYPGTPQD